MVDSKEIQANRTFLEVCMGIERLCAELYHFYSDLYADLPDAASLWKKTAMEEENHQKQFELALRLANDIDFDVSKDALNQAYSIQFKLMRFMEHIKQSSPKLETAVAKALEMEEKLADLHVHTALHFKDSSMQSMFKALSEADRDHVCDLERFQTILNLPHTDMTGI